jgi:protein TonB
MSVSASHTQFAFDVAELNVSRIAAISATVCVHMLAFMFLMVPVSLPNKVAYEDTRTEISLADPVKPKPIIPPKPLVAKPVADKPQTLHPVAVSKPRDVALSTEISTAKPQALDVYVPEQQIGITENVETIAGGNVDASTRAQYPVTYPTAALLAGSSGLVIVLVRYDADGVVTDTRIHKSSRNKDLDRSALLGVKKWKINPGRINGQAIGGEALIEVLFNL